MASNSWEPPGPDPEEEEGDPANPALGEEPSRGERGGWLLMATVLVC